MSQQHSRRVELQISPEVAVIAQGVSDPGIFNKQPWRNTYSRLGAAHTYRLHELPPEYKIEISQ